MVLVPHLDWAHLSARPAALDLSEVRAQVRAQLEGRGAWDRRRLAREIERMLIDRLGAWISGWSWAASEPGGGGLIRSWCCADHSILCEEDSGIEPTVARVVDAVEEWHGLITTLEREFEALNDAHGGLDDGPHAERAAARLLPWVLERTGVDDAWYWTFGKVLSWYLEAAGFDAEQVGGLVQEVIAGRFESWVLPSEETARQTLAAIGEALSALPPPPELDALGEWLRVRGGLHDAPDRAPLAADGHAHARFIERYDRARDPARAERMQEALRECRAYAQAGRPLTFDALCAWQAIVLGQGPVRFRTGPAFARGGRVRYGLEAGTAAKFAKCLLEANEGPPGVATRGARAYLDVCFFHPFEDGNGRAARLALEHVVTAAGLRLGVVEPLFLVARDGGDVEGARGLAWLLGWYLVSASAQPT